MTLHDYVSNSNDHLTCFTPYFAHDKVETSWVCAMRLSHAEIAYLSDSIWSFISY